MYFYEKISTLSIPSNNSSHKENSMPFFQESRTEKNILLLGAQGSGKKSFVLYFRDERVVSDQAPVSFKEMPCPQGNGLFFNFLLSKGKPPVLFNKIKYDLILCLVDLSSINYKKEALIWTQHLQLHFKNTQYLIIGTKSDQRPEKRDLDYEMLATSAKTGEGFEEFSRQLQALLAPPQNERICSGCCLS